MDKSTGPLTFAASFSPDARLASTAGELAAKFAQTTGCAEAAIQGVRDAVGTAFDAALEAAGGASVDLALRAADGSFAADLTSGARSYLHVAHPRTA
jgi:hypothetical protein